MSNKKYKLTVVSKRVATRGINRYTTQMTTIYSAYKRGDPQKITVYAHHNPHGPAHVFDNGEEWWYLRDKIHRTDGPAVTKQCDGRIEYQWYVHGDFYEFNEWCEITNKHDDEVVMLKLKYG